MFHIPSLGESLLYKLLVLADGYRPVVTEYVDPKEFLEIPLQPRRPDELSAETTIRGSILTPRGRGVAYALIEPLGYRDNERSFAGLPPSTDPLAIADKEGRFALRTLCGAVLIARAEGAGYAPRILQVVSDGTRRSWALSEGASLRGRLRFKNLPVPGAVVGIVPVVRDALGLSESIEIATNELGDFLIANIPTNCEYRLYARMDSLPARLSMRTARLAIPEGDSRIDIGSIELEESKVLEGRVLATNGAGTVGAKLRIGREETADHVIAHALSDGRFAVAGIPNETVDLVIQLKGYRLSSKNLGFEAKTLFPFIRVELGDRERELEILVEPDGSSTGDRSRESRQRMLP